MSKREARISTAEGPPLLRRGRGWGWGLLALTLTVPAPGSSGAPPKRKPALVKPAAAAKPAPPPKPLKPGPAWAVAFSPNGARVAVGGYRRVTLYDTATGARTAEWVVSGDAIRALAFSADGKLLAAGTGVPAQSGSVLVLDVSTGKPVRVVSGHDDTVEAVAFAGNLLLSASDDEKVRVSDVSTGANVGVLAEHVGRCLSVAVPLKITEGDNGGIFATGGADNAVKIWDAKARRVVVNFDQCQGPVWCLAFLPQAGTQMTTTRFAAASADGRVRVFTVRADEDGKKGDNQRTGFVAQTMTGHEGPVYAVAASPDGRRLVSGGADKKVIVWNVDNGNKEREMTDAGGDIWGIAVSLDARLVASASLDGKTRVYEIATGKLLFVLPLGSAPPAPAAPDPQITRN